MSTDLSSTDNSFQSKCPRCRRIISHCHYKSIHETCVIVGALLVLLLFGAYFYSGQLQSSTKLYLPYDQIDAYTKVSDKITELLTPYQLLYDLNLLLDVAGLALVLASAATLHSHSRKTAHILLAATAAGVVALDMFVNGMYNSLTSEALTKLPSIIDSHTLKTAMDVQSQFNAAYGFWATAKIDPIAKVISWSSLLALTVAAITARITIDYVPIGPPTPKIATLPEMKPPSSPTDNGMPLTHPSSTKFCRYCGAKVPRVSTFCEECGRNIRTI